MPKFNQTQKQSAVTFSATVFIGSALFLHWRYGGIAALLTLKAAGFFIVGTFVTPLTLGVAFYGMHRALMSWLVRFASGPPSPTFPAIVRALGTALLAVEVVIGYLVTRTAFFWLYT